MDINESGLRELDAASLYDLGRIIGEISRERPDITHRILVGIRDGMIDARSFIGYGFGELLEALERHWFSHVANQDTSPPIRFVRSNTLSGSGKLRFQIVPRRTSFRKRLPVPISSNNYVVPVSESLYRYAMEHAGKPFDPNTPRVTEKERAILREGRLRQENEDKDKEG
jgi:hypothetical protein